MHTEPDHPLGKVLAEAENVLTTVGIEDAIVDVELIAAHVLDVSRGRVQALVLLDARLNAAEVDRVRSLVSERSERVPLQHLTGKAPFRGIELSVGPGVFVPRPETEIVTQFAVDALQAVPSAEPVAVDLCTGSGAIALALANEVPTARVWAVEKSVEAHAWAKRNVKNLGMGRVELLLGDLRELAPGANSKEVGRLRAAFLPLRGSVNVLVSNPPYVPAAMVPRDPEVRDHDPALALYGGDDGLDIIRLISMIGLDLVVSGGTLVLEHAESQGSAIRELLAADGWRATATHQDLTYRDRATTAVR